MQALLCLQTPLYLHPSSQQKKQWGGFACHKWGQQTCDDLLMVKKIAVNVQTLKVNVRSAQCHVMCRLTRAVATHLFESDVQFELL